MPVSKGMPAWKMRRRSLGVTRTWLSLLSCKPSGPVRVDMSPLPVSRSFWWTLRLAKLLGRLPAKNIFRNTSQGPTFQWFSWEMLWTCLFTIGSTVITQYFNLKECRRKQRRRRMKHSFSDTDKTVIVAYFSFDVVETFLDILATLTMTPALNRLVLQVMLLDRRISHRTREVTWREVFFVGSLVAVSARIAFFVSAVATRCQWKSTGYKVITTTFGITFIFLQFRMMLLVVLLVDALTDRFAALNQRLKSSLGLGKEGLLWEVRGHRGQERWKHCRLHEHLKAFCQAHEELCRLVDDLSQSLGWHLLFFYPVCICSIVFSLYCCISASVMRIRSFFIFYAIDNILYFLCNTMSMAHLPLQVNAAVDDVNQISLLDLPPDVQFRVQLLLQKMTISPVEITAAKFFSINRRLLTSIAGAVTTYLVVLMQFKANED